MAKEETIKALYMISVAAELAGMHPQTLRIYEQKGLVIPARTPRNTRLYSDEDISRLRYIQSLTTELGMNLAGVGRVLELEGRIEKMQAKITTLREGVEEASAQLRREVEAVHKSYRRELIPLPSTEVIIATKKKRF